ncbi:hypothetical protein Q8F55_008328 [Vanrija albida]|uniref:Uncharacterized protein n=1 Tax=Vanrija albida TaxID=181172 RepID=A0ABR3PW97_9TREE
MPAPVNPFDAMSQSISAPQSIVFAVVFALLMLVLTVRVVKGSAPTFCYRVLALFSAVRVATFIVRYLVTRAHPTDSDYKTLLIVAGVLVVAGFLFYCEAILELLVVWYAGVRGADLSGFQVQIKRVRHLVLVGISALGIVGAINEVNAVSDGDTSAYNTAKILRQASGGLFLAVSVLALLAVLAVACLGRAAHSTVRVAPGAAVLFTMIAAMTVECVYRVWSASTTSGFVVKQTALDVLLVVPELVILILFAVLSFDDGDVHFVGTRGKHHRLQQDSPENGYPLNPGTQLPMGQYQSEYEQPYGQPYGQPAYGK